MLDVNRDPNSLEINFFKAFSFSKRLRSSKVYRDVSTTKLINSQTKKEMEGNSLAVQWLGLCAFTAKGLSSVPGRGTKIPQAPWPK